MVEGKSRRRCRFTLWGYFATAMIGGMLVGYAAVYPSKLTQAVVRGIIAVPITWGLVAICCALDKSRNERASLP
jgi:DMSO reductase anchor subunit